MRNFKLIVILFALFHLLSCSFTDLTPKYDQRAKTLTVDTLTFGPVNHYAENKDRFGSDSAIYGGSKVTHLFTVDDPYCHFLSVEVLNPDSNVYLNTSINEMIMSQYNESCLTRNFNKVTSLRCIKFDDSVDYYLTSYIPQHLGYGRQLVYKLPNNTCLKKFESHFLDKTEPKNISQYNVNKLDSFQEGLLKGLVE